MCSEKSPGGSSICACAWSRGWESEPSPASQRERAPELRDKLQLPLRSLELKNSIQPKSLLTGLRAAVEQVSPHWQDR